MRDFRKAKPQTARRQRIESYYNYLCEFGVSRGRRGAPAASIDAGLTWARVWTGLGSARSRLARPLFCRCCCRLCGPALCGRWQSRLARARARRGASARAHAIALDRRVPPATAHGTGGLWSAACAIVARGGGA